LIPQALSLPKKINDQGIYKKDMLTGVPRTLAKELNEKIFALTKTLYSL
jgi:hypothetical protein